MELVLPSGKRVRVKLKKQEFNKMRQFFRLFWTRKVMVVWIRIKEWVKRRIIWKKFVLLLKG
jgi:hypothetical protein